MNISILSNLKSIQTPGRFQRFMYVRSLTLLLVLLGLEGIFAPNLMAQTPNCNTVVMACNDNVQVSLTASCTETIVANMILEGQQFPNSAYTVVVRRQNGQVVPNNVVNATHIGMTLNVSVTLNACSLTCHGTITIEDKLGPVITNCGGPFTVECDASTAPVTGIPRPTATDACSAVTFRSTDQETLLPCSSPFVRTITRTWAVTDASGNSSTCIQTINVRRARVADVVFPRSYDDLDLPSFTCFDNVPSLPNGAPDPAFTGLPSGVTCSNIQYYYTDINFPLCGAGKKVFRQWVVIDWCTGEEASGNQVIKIIDSDPPICVAPPDFVFDITTDPGKCTGTFRVPAPTIIFECSSWTYTVGYKLRSPNGSPFENQIFDNITGNATTGYTITGLPQDTTWIVYNIEDACGNQTMCFTEVFVRDNEAPTAVCIGFTVVSLDNTGFADLFATSINNGSIDNCEIDTLLIRRVSTPCGRPQDLQYRDRVEFCCADVSSNPLARTQVMLLVVDKAGNTNECIVNVQVQDKINPTIICPPNVTVDCEADTENLTLLGQPTAADNCTVSVTKTDVRILDDCGLGTIRRTWRAVDGQGRVATCVQVITIRKDRPFSRTDITFPADISINGCSLADAHPDLINSKPTFVNTSCTNLAVSYEDAPFTDNSGACLNIIRTWRVINWCDVNQTNPTIFEGVQRIRLNNSQAPIIISGCQNRVINSPEGDCQEFVQHSIVASDDCTPAEQLRYSWTLDLNNNGSIDATGNTSFFSGNYPGGTHRVTFTVRDACNNTTSCTYTFRIRDNKPPTPVCIAEVTWVISAHGTAEVWASDFDLKSEDTCDGDNLTFSFNAAGNQPARTFTCADIPNGISARIPLRMYVIDSDGNSEFCSVTLILQDSPLTQACPDQANQGATMAGRIVNEKLEGLEEASVIVENRLSAESVSQMTDEEGAYQFNNVKYYGDYFVKPKKADDYANGVSTLDLVMTQQHILGINKLNTPYKLIAADANNSRSITAADLIAIRKVILGIDDAFPNNQSWRFIPSYIEFENPEYPYDFNDDIMVDMLMDDMTNLDFIAIKVGDVNGTATAGSRSQQNTDSRRSPLSITVDQQNFRKGAQVAATFKAGFDEMILGMQFELAFDPSILKLKSINNGSIAINADQYSLAKIAEGRFRLSFDKVSGAAISQEEGLFSIQFEALADGDLSSLQLIDQHIKAEVYDMAAQVYQLDLDVRASGMTSADASKPVLYQNTPNPFMDQTIIGYYVPTEGSVQLRIFDVQGKVVLQKTASHAKGEHQFTISRTEANLQAGIYYYQIETGEFSETKKMLILE